MDPCQEVHLCGHCDVEAGFISARPGGLGWVKGQSGVPSVGSWALSSRDDLIVTLVDVVTLPVPLRQGWELRGWNKV